jgi:HPt (histidine-containing phosphotransfer) domain-containing protein
MPDSPPTSPTDPDSGEAAPTGAEAIPIFRRAAALVHSGDDVEVMHAIAGMFIEGARDRVRAIEEAVRADDPGTLERTAHGLKGTAATLSLERVRASLETLEALGQAGTVSGAADHLPGLARAVEESVDALRTELEGMT